MKNATPTETCSNPTLTRLRLSEIHGVHPSIVLLEDELNIPPLKLPSRYARSLNKELSSMLARKPPVVFRSNRLRCVGNVRIFKIVKTILPPDTQIHCIELFDLTDEQIRTDHLTELLFDPAMFGIHASDLAIIAEGARKAMEMGLWIPPAVPVEDYLSKLYCVDKRKLKPEAQTSGIDLEPAAATATDSSATSTQDGGS